MSELLVVGNGFSQFQRPQAFLQGVPIRHTYEVLRAFHKQSLNIATGRRIVLRMRDNAITLVQMRAYKLLVIWPTLNHILVFQLYQLRPSLH